MLQKIVTPGFCDICGGIRLRAAVKCIGPIGALTEFLFPVTLSGYFYFQ